MAALRSSLRILSGGSSVSSAAAYTGGRGNLDRVLHRAAPPLPAVAPPVTTAAIRNFEGCRRFSTGFGESADKAESGKRAWWRRVKYRMENAVIALCIYSVRFGDTDCPHYQRKLSRMKTPTGSSNNQAGIALLWFPGLLWLHLCGFLAGSYLF